MDKLPKISIIIPTFNSELTLQTALSSIFSQEYKNLEIIVIDGNSSDNTKLILKNNKGKISVVISEADSGVYDAMNKGAKLASGDWIYFLGSDDVMLDGSLKKMAVSLKSQQTVYYGDVIFKHANVRYAGRVSTFRLMYTNYPHQAIFYPRSVFEGFSFNLKYKILADYVLNIRLTNVYSFEYIDLPIAVFNDRDGLSSTNVDVDFEKDRVSLLRAEFGSMYALLIRCRMVLVSLKGLIIKVGIRSR